MVLLKVLKWLWASYETLALWQWLTALPIGGALMGVLQYTSSWPIWTQGIVAAIVALVWLTILAFAQRLFARRDEQGMKQSQKNSPGAQQGKAGGNLAQSSGGHAVVTGDFSPVTIGETKARLTPLVPVLDGVIRGPNIFVRIQNTDDFPHQYKVVFHGVSGMAGNPRVRDLWLPWNCGGFQLIGPKQSEMVQVAQADGEDKRIGKVIRFIHDKGQPYDGRLSEYVAFGGALSLDLELQSDAGLAIQSRRQWTLEVDANGTPSRFMPQ